MTTLTPHILAAILAILATSAAQAQSIHSIARFSDYTVALSDMPCPNNPSAKTAVYISYAADRGKAYGCWTGGRIHVSIRWFRINTSRTPPESMDGKLFENAND